MPETTQQPTPPADHASDTAPQITVYWRPMCGYCERLKSQLAGRGVPYRTVDIWSDRGQAEVVRRATGGDEIVPTVQVGDDVFLVNPSVEQVLDAAGLTA